jgi:D-alanine-D-alanine ligase
MRIGIAFDLKEDFRVPEGREDLLEEYDCPGTVDAIRRELEQLGHEVLLLGGGRRFLENLTRSPVDLVFNIAEGRGGRTRESQVPAVCEMLGVPCTHSDALALGLSLDKDLCMRIARSAGLPTPFQHLVRTAQEGRALRPPLPVVLKPVHEGSSMGVRDDSLVRSHDDMHRKIARLIDLYRQPVVVEQFLPGSELTVGIVGNAPPEVLGVMEIAPKSGGTEGFLYSIETKRDYKRLVSYFCPPRSVPAESVVEAGRIAIEIFDLLGCCDAARVDLRLDASGRPTFLEVNPLPGISPVYSDLCIMASLLGVSYGALIRRILEAATARLGLEGKEPSRNKVYITRTHPPRQIASAPAATDQSVLEVRCGRERGRKPRGARPMRLQ